MRKPKNLFTVFFSDSKLIGVSFWRTLPTSNKNCQVIYQGKLRIDSKFRRHGIHILAVLKYYFTKQWKSPFTKFYFLSIASLFNFVSMRKQVIEYTVFPNMLETLVSVLRHCAQQDRFEIEEKTGCINVHVIIHPQVFSEFPSSYYEMPEAQQYILLNPKYKEGYDLSYAYPFSVVNVCSSVFRLLSLQWRNTRLGPFFQFLSDILRSFFSRLHLFFSKFNQKKKL